MAAIAIGRLGLSVGHFYDLTPNEFTEALKQYSKNLEHQYRENWERTRTQTVALLNIHIDKNKQIKDPTKLWKFPWDKTTTSKEVPIMTQEKLKAFEKRWQEKGL
ncbi:hypothetical protein [Xanthovirga aplysinae]|uniref:hypothetical protein n=1 Tax=Xanthovirga aplysinae TaxID=2529853 RepID=UPI0012BB7E69|nr:hypothetical protein [Xanthovirga aplysinae]MTI32818.1 hypothetical protein [Xanthovirga aplysinae]